MPTPRNPGGAQAALFLPNADPVVNAMRCYRAGIIIAVVIIFRTD